MPDVSEDSEEDLGVATKRVELKNLYKLEEE